jgi:hypothetical protein
MIYDLVQSFMTTGFSGKKMSGGAAVAGSSMSGWSLFFSLLLIFIIKVLLVMISYNMVAPTVLEKWGKNPQEFRPLSFVECIFIVILFNNLFSRF